MLTSVHIIPRNVEWEERMLKKKIKEFGIWSGRGLEFGVWSFVTVLI